MSRTPFSPLGSLCIGFLFVLNLVYWINCNSEERWFQDILACNLVPWDPDYDNIFEEIERILMRSGIHIAYVSELYKRVSQLNELWQNVNHQDSNSLLWISALTLLDRSDGLQIQDCFDICTYVLARNCCKYSRRQDACYPRSKKQTFIKSMIDARVFPMIERCQSSLMSHAILMNATLIDPDLYAQVSVITEFMSVYKSERFDSIQKIALANPRPYFSIRGLIKPSSTGFFEEIFDVMIRLEKLTGESALEGALRDQVFDPSTGPEYFDRLIMVPCKRFIGIMRSIMDSTLFSGGIIDLDRSKFRLGDLGDVDRIKYFKLLHIYQACVWLDDRESYNLDWWKLTRNLASSSG